jgi:hypothetical protein
MTVAIWGIDVARYGTISFTMTETGGGGATGTVTISAGQYIALESGQISALVAPDAQTGELSAMSLGYTSLLDEIETQMNAIGNATYVVSLAIGTFRPRFYAAAAGSGVTSVAISSISTPAKRALGWDNGSLALDGTFNATWEPWHTCVFANGGASEWSETEAEIDGEDLVGSDGSRRGLVAVGASRLLDFVVPLEPLASIYDESAPSVNDRTWQRTLRRVRTHEPAWIVDAKRSGYVVVGYLRADSCTLRPRLMAADYLAYQSIPLGFHVIGWSS